MNHYGKYIDFYLVFHFKWKIIYTYPETQCPAVRIYRVDIIAPLQYGALNEVSRWNRTALLSFRGLTSAAAHGQSCLSDKEPFVILTWMRDGDGADENPQVDSFIARVVIWYFI